MKIYNGIATLALTLCAFTLSAQQSNIDAVKQFLLDQETVKEQDVTDLVITDEYVSKHNGVTHLYGSQAINGVRISNSNFSAVFNKEGELIHVGTNLIGMKGLAISPNSPSTDVSSAVIAAVGNDIQGLELSANEEKLVLSNQNGYSHETKVALLYFKTPESGLRLVWNFNVDMPTKDHWWDYYVDAQTNEILQKIDWQLQCSAVGHQHSEICNHSETTQFDRFLLPPPTIEDGSSYNVFEFPIESPNHGARTIVVEPALEAASPFGWHDVDGIEGSEYEITRGNNVHAYEDASDTNDPGFSPLPTTPLAFDYPLVTEDGPESYTEASITNLFYATNRIHDLLFLYGFDEAAGNFQEKNYTDEGEGSDVLRAEAQDGGGFNNANMATPPEGNRPRMQMYLWTTESSDYSTINVNEPTELAGTYSVTRTGNFGPGVPEGGITGNLAYAYDGVGANENDLCTEALNPEELSGNIAIFSVGSCINPVKAMFAQEAGAVACLFVNNVNGLDNFFGTPNPELTIPSVMISMEEGNELIAALENGDSVNVTLFPDPAEGTRDGSFDNGVVIHEYVHGLSTRLTGGPSNTGCLWNDEAMGEGWSDWYATMMTMDMTVNNPVYRPMGTFANGEAVNGIGIRPAPYDTSFAVNNFTYDDIGNNDITIPHGVGFVWATMLWDLTWAFIDEYGYQDIETGIDGGNNIVMQLVTDGLKLQPCSPGFVDGRDAILLADQINNDGANQCLIWNVFARRGLGYSADQGSSQSRGDGTEAFDLPTICQTALVAPIAAFSANPTYNCDGFVQFEDESIDIPQAWFWDFGDGTTSDEQNPSHVYPGQGVYSVSLTVTNSIGENTNTELNYVEVVLPTTPVAEGGSGCEGEEIELSATNAIGGVVWYDSDNNEVGNDETLSVTLGANSEAYTAYGEIVSGNAVFVGPETEDFGGGGNHGSSFTGTVDFEVLSPMEMVSAYVYSGATGVRTINLWDGLSANGEIIDQAVVNIDFIGGGRIDLGFSIDIPGEYSIGLNEADLYRNESGTNYPYEGGTFMNIVGSSAGPDYYYYFYDLEIEAPSCLSEGVEVMAEVNGSALFTFESNSLTVEFTAASTDVVWLDWDFGDNSSSGELNPTHTYATPGVYTVTLSTSDGCVYEMEVDVINTGVESFEAAGINFMPNPANDVLHLQLPNNSSNLQNAKFFDMSGRVVKTYAIGQGGNVDISVGDFANGIYLLVLENNFSQPMYQQKISIVH